MQVNLDLSKHLPAGSQPSQKLRHQGASLPPKSQQAEQPVSGSPQVPSELDPVPPMDGEPVPYAEYLAMKTDFEVRLLALENYIFGT